MATLKDIATRVGVSVRTVSRALSGNGYVNAAIRQRVLDTAAELGYTPDLLARSLRLGRTQEIVAIATTVDELHMARIAGLEAHLRAHGYSTGVQMVSEQELAEPQELVVSLVKRRPAGVALVARVGFALQKVRTRLEAAGVRYVIMDTDEYPPAVRIDRSAGVAEAVRYLARAGRKHIAYVGPSQSMDRIAGYRQALEELGRPELLHDPGSVYREGVPALLERFPGIDAIQAYSDERALELLAGLHDAGVKVPADIAVIGFDDRWAARYAWPPLSTVAQPSRAVGEHAARYLIDDSRGACDISLPTELVIRESA
jgi:DNA-binding LacI/PurR family transcriptional regulator